MTVPPRESPKTATTTRERATESSSSSSSSSTSPLRPSDRPPYLNNPDAVADVRVDVYAPNHERDAQIEAAVREICPDMFRGDGDGDGDDAAGGPRYRTVRRLRVLTTHVRVADDAESLASSLDAEALAVVLFHKLHAAASTDGLGEARTASRNWLLSALMCCYRNAERTEELRRERAERGVDPDALLDDSRGGGSGFYPSDRLLDVPGGTLSDRDVLLAQGHERLCSLPLLAFSMLCCDALREGERGGTYRPSADARCAAAANMGNMSPGALARCIAPRMELWSCPLTRKDASEASAAEGEGGARGGGGGAAAALTVDSASGPLVDSIEMSMTAVREAVQDHADNGRGEGEGGDGLVLLLDSPRQIMLYDCRDLASAASNLGEIPPPAGVGGGGTGIDAGDAEVNETLRSVIAETVRSYRATPPVRYALKANEGGRGIAAGGGYGVPPLSHINDAMVEDAGVPDEEGRTTLRYDEWCDGIAGLIHDEIRAGATG
uniref:Uncharacterized protein n=1 Tax=Odontella aurita TaxID=265563 RepID=A0A7S4JAP5_9STRA|mmetsp:Transcript_42694/g.129688  ORF Transcript_42694/g.129688 Transcript_42694/m.129688 type:complete len:495 (+) Transcript_42694:89-1573(+)